MDLSNADQHQHQHQQSEMASQQTLESMLVCPPKPHQAEKKARPQPEQALKCPRCDSTNTKFCYYNNYSLSQPRYFCKSCRRYWTKGGTLRNVPVGGGCRKNKRPSSSSSSSKIKGPDHYQPLSASPSPLISTGPLPAFSYDHLPILDSTTNLYDNMNPSLMNSPNSAPPALLDGLKSSFFESPISFNGLYYEMGDANISCVNMNVNANAGQQGMGMACEEATMVKQEIIGREGEGENRVLWGLPWQVDGINNVGGDVDSAGRDCWINGFGSWHGLVNSPLM
ncbi:hypothetical protein NMG60_11015766 [Bertholletia excelsa]